MSHPNFRTGEPCNCSFGRYLEEHQFTAASMPPWEPGASGKGIYFPETGQVVTWVDNGLTHSDVWFNTKYEHVPGPAHHFNIDSAGGVTDQGAINRNFETEEGDPEGFAQALEAYDPALKLVTKDQWSFNSTEPQPSRLPEDEERHDGVQIREDFQGWGS